MTEYEKILILVGCGKMGGALARRWVSCGEVAPEALVCLDRSEAAADALAAELGAVRTIPAPSQIPRFFVMAVKPGELPGVLESYQDHFTELDTVISVAAGVSIARLREAAGPLVGVVRTMPNTPALVGAGTTGVMGDGTVDMAVIRGLFSAVGSVVVLEKEEHFDALTAISGSGPAYFFTAIEALADGGVKMGLPRAMAVELARGTLEGAARLVAESDLHTAELKDRVASPGGTTIAALTMLEEKGFRHALISAVEAATRRSQEMNQE